jgi:non-heme chloroperoxidase
MAREMTINGLTMAVEAPATASSTPPILFLPGLSSAAWTFERYQPFFAKRGFTSYALNFRGHGNSRPVSALGRLSIDDYVDDALEVAKSLGKPIVIGHSMGGLVAQRLAERDAVLAMVLICSAPPAGISALSARLALRMVRTLPSLLLSQPLVPRRADVDALALNRVPAAERAAIFARFVPESGRAAREIALGRIAVNAARVTCPVLSVAAADDRLVPERICRRVAARYDAPHRAYAAMGHMMVIEPGWEEPASHILKWLDAAIKLTSAPSLRDTMAGAPRLS